MYSRLIILIPQSLCAAVHGGRRHMFYRGPTSFASRSRALIREPDLAPYCRLAMNYVEGWSRKVLGPGQDVTAVRNKRQGQDLKVSRSKLGNEGALIT